MTVLQEVSNLDEILEWENELVKREDELFKQEDELFKCVERIELLEEYKCILDAIFKFNNDLDVLRKIRQIERLL